MRRSALVSIVIALTACNDPPGDPEKAEPPPGGKPAGKVAETPADAPGFVARVPPTKDDCWAPDDVERFVWKMGIEMEGVRIDVERCPEDLDSLIEKLFDRGHQVLFSRTQIIFGSIKEGFQELSRSFFSQLSGCIEIFDQGFRVLSGHILRLNVEPFGQV